MMTEALESPHLPEAVQGDQTHLCLPSRPSWIEPAVEYLKHRALLCGACQESRAGKVLVALHEALNNALVHGNLEISSGLKEAGDGAFARALAARAADPAYAGRTVDVFVDYDGGRCRWAITDQGRGFDVEAVVGRPADDDPEALLASGRGILLMRSFMDDVRYEAGGRRVILTLHKSSGQEARRHERLPLHAPVRVAPVRPDGSVDWDAAYAAVSRDLSAGGIGLLQDRLAVAERVMIAVEEGGRTLYFPAEVRHCRAVGGDVVELGCRLQIPAPEDEPAGELAEALGRLLDRARGSVPPDERRRHGRVPFNEPVEIRTGPGAAPLLGFPRNLSRGGIAFITTAPLPAAFTLLFPGRGGEPPLPVRAEVVRSARVQEGFYDVAARFVGLGEVGPG
jgi:anti-sigma regulatory factor (Ser/Thr protein kinase)